MQDPNFPVLYTSFEALVQVCGLNRVAISRLNPDLTCYMLNATAVNIKPMGAENT